MNFGRREALAAALLAAVLLPSAWFLLLHEDMPPDSVPAASGTGIEAPGSKGARLLRIVADDWCPVSCEGSDGAPAGYAVDLARAVFSAAGYDVQYSVQPWARALAETRKGSAQVIVGTLVSNAPDFIYPQETIGTNTNVFFTRADNSWQYQGMASLDSIVVGVANEYVFGEPFDSYVLDQRDNGERLQVIHSDDPVMQAFSLLDAGRIGTYLDDRMVVRWTARQANVPLELREAGTVSSIPLYVAFSPADARSRELAQIFDAGVRRLRASGKLAEILAAYRINDWNPRAPE
jgi:polar amino acid transport system substrate-binding protein